MALWMCRVTRHEPSILLHPLDFLGKDDVPSLGFFPGMGLSTESKLQCAEHYLARLQSHFEVLSLGDHADAIGRRKLQAPRNPQFSA